MPSARELILGHMTTATAAGNGMCKIHDNVTLQNVRATACSSPCLCPESVTLWVAAAYRSNARDANSTRHKRQIQSVFCTFSWSDS